MQSAGILYFAWILLFFAPKLLGILDAALRGSQNTVVRAVGAGRPHRTRVHVLTHSGFDVRGDPLHDVAGNRTTIGLGCAAQKRPPDYHAIGAARSWLPTAYGMLLCALVAIENGAALFWFLPFLLGLVLCIPFVALTSDPALNAWALRKRLCAVPEELSPRRKSRCNGRSSKCFPFILRHLRGSEFLE